MSTVHSHRPYIHHYSNLKIQPTGCIFFQQYWLPWQATENVVDLLAQWHESFLTNQKWNKSEKKKELGRFNYRILRQKECDKTGWSKTCRENYKKQKRPKKEGTEKKKTIWSMIHQKGTKSKKEKKIDSLGRKAKLLK